MLKKALVASAVLAATSVAFANGGAIEEPHHVGAFYAGIGISRDTAHVETDQRNLYDITYRNENALPPDVASFGGRDRKKFDWSMEGWDGQLFAGYGLMFQDRYWLALEGWGGITSNEGKFDKFSTIAFRANGSEVFSQGFQTHAKLEQDWSAGVSLLPGIKITDNTLLFARVGWIISEFEVRGRIDGHHPYAFIVDGPIGRFLDVDGAITRFNNDETLNGIQAGLGMQTMVTDRIGLRGEWDWAEFENFNATRRAVDVVRFGNGGIDPNGPESLTFNNATRVELKNPITDTFRFSVLYKFGAA